MKLLLMPWTAVLPILKHLFDCFESILNRSGNKGLILVLLGVVVWWHIYTPIHELLHVAACLAGGGSVTELALKPQYGGTILQHIFPFIVPESEYAGQLTGFSTPNYFVYALVDFAPYILSLVGVSLIELCRRGNRSFVFGLAVILTLIPIMSLPGDYYEAASLITTQIAESLDETLPEGVMISDDVFKSVSTLKEKGHWGGPVPLLVGVGVVLGIWFILLTLALQIFVARWMVDESLFRPVSGTVDNSEAKPTSLSQQTEGS